MGCGEDIKENNKPPKRSLNIVKNEFENIKFVKSIGKSIESLYILKDIFSYLSEKNKLKIIIIINIYKLN